MAFIMNEYDVEDAVRIHTRASQPNRLGAAYALQHLVEWTNSVSDGWPYWSKPSAASKALQQIAAPLYESADVSDADLAKAATPLKSFCTRQQREGRMTAAQREIILRSLS